MKNIINVLNHFLFKKRHARLVSDITPMKRVLIVSNTALGDTILSTPVIKTLRYNFPNLYIVLMINKKLYPLFKNYKSVDHIVTYNKSFLGLIGHVFYIKKNCFDSLLFLHSNGPQDLFLALASNVPRVCKAINYPNRLSKEFMELIKHPSNYDKKQHIIEHRLDTIRNLHLTHFDTSLSLPQQFYKKKKKQNDQFKIGFQLGAAELYKIWPIERFITLAQLILKHKNITLCLFGIQSENQLAQQLESAINNPKRVINYCGKTNINELPNIIQDMDLLITNDTGSLHLAIALKIRTISLFSPTDSQIFGPYQDLNLHLVIQKKYCSHNTEKIRKTSQKAMTLISVDEVYEAFLIQYKRIKQCVE